MGSAPDLLRWAGAAVAIWLATSPVSEASTQPEATQRLPLSSWKVWHTVPRDTTPGYFAYVSDPDGYIHRVEEGDRLGTEFGRIVHISQCRIDVVELKADGRGGWLESPRVILREPHCQDLASLSDYRLNDLVLVGTKKNLGRAWMACFLVPDGKVLTAYTNELIGRMFVRVSEIDASSVTLTLVLNGDESTTARIRWPIAGAAKRKRHACP